MPRFQKDQAHVDHTPVLIFGYGRSPADRVVGQNGIATTRLEYVPIVRASLLCCVLLVAPMFFGMFHARADANRCRDGNSDGILERFLLVLHRISRRLSHDLSRLQPSSNRQVLTEEVPCLVSIISEAVY
jgi:hypothetical protein